VGFVGGRAGGPIGRFVCSTGPPTITLAGVILTGVVLLGGDGLAVVLAFELVVESGFNMVLGLCEVFGLYFVVRLLVGLRLIVWGCEEILGLKVGVDLCGFVFGFILVFGFRLVFGLFVVIISVSVTSNGLGVSQRGCLKAKSEY